MVVNTGSLNGLLSFKTPGSLAHTTAKERKDREDLKALIELTVHWIEMEELTEAVMKDMPEGK